MPPPLDFLTAAHALAASLCDSSCLWRHGPEQIKLRALETMLRTELERRTAEQTANHHPEPDEL
jgi:hypothetical protein